MALPPSFARDGFEQFGTKRKYRRLMIGTEGETESGKSEFIASAPGPGICICLDRGHEAMLDNPRPPKSRNSDILFHALSIPLETQATKDDYGKAWQNFKAVYYKAIANPDALTVALDTDNASWELQQLAEFGKLTQIPPIMRTGVKAARRAFISRGADSGKNIIGTNMLKDEYVDEVDEEGNLKLDDKGRAVQKRTGGRIRQGFPDTNYLWQVQIRHMVKPPEMVKVGGKTIARPGGGEPIVIGGSLTKTKPEYGIEILKCKMRGDLVGETLWGDKCNFAGLVQLIYPQVPLSQWGYK